MTARSQRKHRSSVGGDLDVVTSNHRAVLGDAPAELAKAAERPDRHPVYWRTFALLGWGLGDVLPPAARRPLTLHHRYR